METRELIERRLRERLEPVYLEVLDDSQRHAGHAGARGGGGHFIVTIVSAAFEGKSLVAQHRMVYELFADELKQHIHAMALKTWTPAQWTARSGGPP
jgi:BolA protein